MYVCTYICLYMYMYICIYIYMYIYQDYGAQVAAWIKHLLVQASTVKFYGLGFGV